MIGNNYIPGLSDAIGAEDPKKMNFHKILFVDDDHNILLGIEQWPRNSSRYVIVDMNLLNASNLRRSPVQSDALLSR
jgi:hypothetical protein